MTEILKVIRERRSTRAFKPAQLPRETMEKILQAGVWAPSAGGKQPWCFVAVHSAEKTLALSKVVGTAAHRGEDYQFYGAPATIIVSCPRDSVHADLDGGAAIQNMLLMAHSMGVGSCWIDQIRATCEDADVRAMLSMLGVPSDHVVVGSIALGYIAKETPAKERRADIVKIVE